MVTVSIDSNDFNGMKIYIVKTAHERKLASRVDEKLLLK